MKTLGRSDRGYLVELPDPEYRHLLTLGGVDIFNDGLGLEIDLEKVLYKVSKTRLGRIIDYLRNVADDLEKVE